MNRPEVAWAAWERYCAERGWDPVNDELGGEYLTFAAGFSAGLRREHISAMPAT